MKEFCLFDTFLGIISFIFTLFIGGVFISVFLYADSSLFDTITENRDVLYSIILSLITATITAILSVMLGIPVAYWLSTTKFYGKYLIDILFHIPIVLSPVALATSILIFLNTAPGQIFNSYFGPFVFTIKGIILAQFFVVFGLAIQLLKSSFDNMDEKYIKVARTLGYSPKEVFFKVSIPMAKNNILAALILTWARAMGEFGATITLAGIIKNKTLTLPMKIYLSISADADIKLASALISIVIIISTLTLLSIRYLNRRQFNC